MKKSGSWFHCIWWWCHSLTTAKFILEDVAENWALLDYEYVTQTVQDAQKLLAHCWREWKPQQQWRLSKIGLLLNTFHQRCLNLSLEEHLCIKEQINPFKGKPWGVKIFISWGGSWVVSATSLLTKDQPLNWFQRTCNITGAYVLYLAKEYWRCWAPALFWRLFDITASAAGVSWEDYTSC